VAGCNNPWAASMRPYMQRLLGTDSLGAKTLELLTAAWAKSTSDTYNSAIKPYFQFCEEQGLPPLAATTATMARYIAWIGERGTIKATSLQPYLSAVNGFFKDHGAEPVAQGELVAKVRRGLAASQVSLQPSRTRLYLPARILVSSLRLAKDLRTQLTDTWTQAQAELILLFRACLATVLLATFFCRGGAGVECRSGDLLCTPTGGILLYHGTRKGQRGTSTERKLLCELPASAHPDMAKLLQYFDAARTRFSAGKIPDRRWAISVREPTTNWTADTLTAWLQRVLCAVHEQPPDGFAWTSHSLRKGAATAAYSIGTPMQKIKFFGGWARESDVVLDYIDPTVLPCPGAWQLFGWMTPGGPPPNVTRQSATDGISTEELSTNDPQQ